jgi:hypothetical protein
MTPEEGLALERQNLRRMVAIVAVWDELSAYLHEIRMQQVDKLIVREDNEVRGRIKQLDELLQLPDNIVRAQLSLSGLPQ